jgi:hypothetical protein
VTRWFRFNLAVADSFVCRCLNSPREIAGPLACGPLCLHAVANTPAGLMELVRSYRSTNFGLPTNQGGSAPALSVSGPAQRSLTLRPARSPGRLATLCTRGFSSFVASTTALIATGWSEPVPGRVTPDVDHRLFTTHPVTRLIGS